MKRVLLAVVALFFAVSCIAKEVSGSSYAFTVPEDVTFSFKNEGIEFYTFNWGTPPEIGMLMFFANPAPMSEAMLVPMKDLMLVQVKDQMTAQGMELKSVSDQSVEVGGFKGFEIEMVVVQAQTGLELTQYVFILRDADGKGWNANVTSMAEGSLEKAKAILKSAKKKVEEKESAAGAE